MKSVAFATLGCKVNMYETEAMIELFRKSGYAIVDFEESADIYVINTCTVTSFGDKKSRQMIRKAKRENNDAIIAVVGCYSQVAPDKVMEIPGVNVVVGTHDRKRIVEFIEDFIRDKAPIKHVGNIMNVGEFEELDIDEFRDKTRAFLKIQDGCNNFCSYCLIPYARGPIRSLEPDKVLDQVIRLRDSGFKEVILSGIHIASYGKDLNSVNLLDLIDKVQYVEGIERIRIGSLEPTFFSDSVIERFKNIPKLCRHFHISLQSGCDGTLKRMNRHYTTSEYENIVYKLRDSMPEVSITTDIIVGFPGETDDEFNKTYEYLKKLELSKTHIFKYSPREGTPAANFKDQLPPEKKDVRSNILLKLNSVNESKYTDRFIGKNMMVLYETQCNESQGYIEGYTDNYINVKSLGDSESFGKILKTLLLENHEVYATGKILI